ncbi:MAG TPA: hypothetical protein VGK74_00955 [Symbiobacteriaceae bacterium]
MSKTIRTALAALLVAVAALSLSACIGATGGAPSAPAGGAAGEDQPGNAVVASIAQSAAPQELQAWARSQQNSETSAFKVVAKDGVTYAGVAAGLKRNGGYRIGLKRSFATTVAGTRAVQLEVGVAPPPSGAITTAALVNPMAFFKVTGTMPVSINIVNDVAPAVPGQ